MATAKTNSNTTSKDVTIADLSAQIEALKADLADLSTTTASFVEQRGRAAAGQAKDSAEAALEKGLAQAGDLGDQASKFVQERPTTALGIAVGLGLIVGLLTARR